MNTGTADDLTREIEKPDALHTYALKYFGIDVPRTPVCPNHCAPFEYLRLAYFEPARDLVVWAPRGGGKTRLAAAATFLDLVQKPGCGVRILGGSLEQSLRMWEHLVPDILEKAESLIGEKPARKRITLKNKSSVAVLTQSQRAVRGLRVQKIRCDEVELFDPKIWEAVQLATRSQNKAAAAIEAISTLHNPFGLMNRIVDEAAASGKTVLHWCLLEVLERCPAERDCATCPLWEDCRGVAKTSCRGFVSIDDAIRMKLRVSKDTWESEMLCKRPSVSHCVFPSFDPAIHVRDFETKPTELSLAIDFGFAAPFVCLWIATDDNGITHVIDEYVQEGRTVEEHLQQIESRFWGRAKIIACDPAGAGRNDQTAVSNVALLRKKRYDVRHHSSKIVDGLEMIRAELSPASGSPRLFIHPRCKRLIKAMRAYHYSPLGSELPVKDGVHDHAIDALRYHFVNRNRTREIRSRTY